MDSIANVMIASGVSLLDLVEAVSAIPYGRPSDRTVDGDAPSAARYMLESDEGLDERRVRRRGAGNKSIKETHPGRKQARDLSSSSPRPDVDEHLATGTGPRD